MAISIPSRLDRIEEILDDARIAVYKIRVFNKQRRPDEAIKYAQCLQNCRLELEVAEDALTDELVARIDRAESMTAKKGGSR